MNAVHVQGHFHQRTPKWQPHGSFCHHHPRPSGEKRNSITSTIHWQRTTILLKMETNKEEEKHPSDPPADTPQSSRQEEQLSNNCDNNSKDDKKDIGSETPNEKEEETPSKQRDNLPTAPSVNSIPSIPSSSPSFASPHGMISPYASFYNHPPAPHSTNASHFNRHNHAMLSSMKTFPEKLHQILDYAAQNGLEDIISFFSHGGAFKVHKVGSRGPVCALLENHFSPCNHTPK